LGHWLATTRPPPPPQLLSGSSSSILIWFGTKYKMETITLQKLSKINHTSC
jgi:hypothetical protein